jgi:hypothetical protein
MPPHFSINMMAATLLHDNSNSWLAYLYMYIRAVITDEMGIYGVKRKILIN